MSRAVRPIRLRRRVALLVVLLGLAACSETTAPPRPAAMTLSPAQDTLAIGSTLQLSANVLSAAGSTISGYPVEWSSSAPLTASVSPAGVVTALAAGSATITAEAGAVSRTAAIYVQPAACGAPVGGALTVGGSRSGNMAAGPCLLFDSFTAVGYTMSLGAAGGVSLTLSTSGFIGEILIVDQSGGFVAGSDAGVTPRIRAALDAGTYRVWVVSNLAPSASQTFTLSAATAGGDCANTPVTRILDIGVTAAASVTDQSCILIDGPAAEGWRLVLTEPTRIRATASASAFAPTVAITSTDQQDLITFSIGNTPGSVSAAATLEAGEYLVWGGSFEYLTGTVQVGVEVVPPCTPSGVLSVGAPANGLLEATDCTSISDAMAFADVWTFTVAESGTRQLDLTSTAFDAFLELRDANDVLIAWNDDAIGLNSRIVISLAPGTYRVWASSFNGGSTGAYTLSAAVVSGALQTERASSGATSSRSEKPARRRQPQSWPAPRTGGTDHR